MIDLLRRSLVARRLLPARLLSVWGDTFYAMAAMWVTLELTGSAWQMAMVALAEVVPYLLFSAVAGALVDRWNPKRVMLILDLVQAAVVAAVPVVYVAGFFSPWMLTLVGFLLATCRTLYGPATMAYYSATVSTEDLPALLGMLTAAMRSGSIVVPILLGVFFQHIDLVPAFLADGLSFLLSAVLIGTLPAPASPVVRADGKGNLRRDLRQGWSILAQRRFLLLAMITGMLGSLVRSPIFRFALPLIATGSLHAGESGFKLLQFAQGIGGVVGALLANQAVSRSRSHLGTTLAGWGVSGVGTLIVGLSPIWLGRHGVLPTGVGLALSAFGTPIAYTATGVFMQTAVPGAHIGKVAGLYTTLDMSGDYGGLLLMPLLMTWFSAESVLAVGGCFTVLFCVTAFVWARRAMVAEVDASESGVG